MDASQLTTPDPDAVELMEMGEQALQLAQQESPNVILIQVFTDLSQTAFRFMESTETREINVLVPAPSAPVGEWRVHIDPIARTGPGIDLRTLRIGPNRAAAAMLAQWPGCEIAGLGLYLFGAGDKLAWDISCNTPEGVVKGSLGNLTGLFQLIGGPAVPPVTASP